MKRSSIVLWAAACAYIVVIGLWWSGVIDKEILVALAGGISAMVFFLLQNTLETARFQRELFVSFNETYSRLNDKLDAVVSRASQGELDPADRKHLQDYFNLCAEEYFYHKRGYVDNEVWRNWLSGMNWWYDADARVADYWKRELEKGSYYGMSLETLRRGRLPSGRR